MNNISLVMSTDGGSEFERQLPATGLDQAVIFSIVDFGTQEGNYGPKRQIEITCELPNQTGEFDGKEEALFISQRFTLSLHPKATLHKAAAAMLGQPLPENFDVMSLSGLNVMINIAHVKKEDRTYANIISWAPLMGNLQPVQPSQPIINYVCGASPEEVFFNLPEWKQTKIKLAPEFLPF